ncbi:MAG: hypothetical protein ACFE7R_11905 [Candidatus Hodarchaeota archaeon]
MNWLSKIMNSTADEFSHAKLMKYGMGTHPGPRVMLKLSKNRISFKADLDYEKIFIRAYLKGAPEGSHKVKGIVKTYTDKIADFDTLQMPLYWKKSKGKLASVFNAKLDDAAPLSDIQSLVEIDDPTTFFLLSLNPRDGKTPWKVTTKTSFPKGGPSDDEETEKDPTFVKGALANTPDVLDYVLSELNPELKGKIGPKTKDVIIKNQIVIEDIVIPDDPNISFSEKRKLAKKKGRIIQRTTVDDEEYSREYEFFV